MKLESSHVAMLDADGVYEVRCCGPAHSECWQYENDCGEMIMTDECQIALWCNESEAAIHGRIMVPLEIDAWDEDGVEATMVGHPSVIRVIGGSEYPL